MSELKTRREHVLRVTSVTKRFGRQTVLRDQALEVAAGEAVAIIGQNGAGKSTLLKIAAGLLAPDAGSVQIFGRLGYCPQVPGLLDHLTTDDHLALFGAARGLIPPLAQTEGRSILLRLNFHTAWTLPVKHMSGGDQQKLNLSLALLGDPDVLLLDEPYQGFDFGTYVDFWDQVDDWRTSGKAIVVVTHMLAELRRVDRTIEIARADTNHVDEPA